MSHKSKRLCPWAVIGGFHSVLFVKQVERWMAKDIRYACNTESGYKTPDFLPLRKLVRHLKFDLLKILQEIMASTPVCFFKTNCS